MRSKVTRIKRRRIYSEEFKRKIVLDYEKGIFTVKELSKLYEIQDAVIYRWIYRFSTYNKKSVHIVEMKESSTKKIKDLEDRIKELERAVGQKQLYIDYMEKMVEIAKDDLGVDIKKNYNTPQLTGSGKTKKK